MAAVCSECERCQRLSRDALGAAQRDSTAAAAAQCRPCWGHARQRCKQHPHAHLCLPAPQHGASAGARQPAGHGEGPGWRQLERAAGSSCLGLPPWRPLLGSCHCSLATSYTLVGSGRPAPACAGGRACRQHGARRGSSSSGGGGGGSLPPQHTQPQQRQRRPGIPPGPHQQRPCGADCPAYSDAGAAAAAQRAAQHRGVAAGRQHGDGAGGIRHRPHLP